MAPVSVLRYSLLSFLLSATFLHATLFLQATSPSTKCPKACVCTQNFTNVNCDRMNLNEVPKDVPKSAQVLILSHNNFGNLENDFFPSLPNLTALHLDVSKITGLQPHAFRGLPKLRQLFLFSNQIGKLNESEFCRDLPDIQDVYLDRNILVQIPNFGNCSQLVTLTLENNQIHSFKFPDEYSNLRRLKGLTLSLNSVPVLRKGDFKALSGSKLSRLLISRIDLARVEPGTFSPIATNLNALKISYNPLNATLLGPIFLELSKCAGLTSLNLDGLQFKSRLPPGLFEPFRKIRLTSLSLSNNEIGTIETNTFSPLVKLIHLSLKGSHISAIEPTAFDGLQGLNHLDLSRNSLTDIPANLPSSLTDITLERNHITMIRDNAMAKLGHLNKLQLQKNAIQQLRTQAFGGLKQLVTLDLSSNLISSIPKATLSPLRRLVTLNLHNNRLNKIIHNVDVFEQLKSLTYLDLSDNDCDTLPYYIFRNLTGLRVLNLANNRLKYMLANDKYGGTFAGLENLRTLNLENNDIASLSSVIFRHLSNLRNLLVSKNRLTSWNRKLFTFTQRIENLDLSRNKIPVIDDHSLGWNYSHFKTLNLEDNPFACTCDLVWFCKWAIATKVRLIHFDNYTCDWPKSRQGLKLKDFDWQSLVCFNYTPYIIAASVLGGVLLVTCIIILLYRCRWRINLYWYLCGQKCCKQEAEYALLQEDNLRFHAYISFDKKTDLTFVHEELVQVFDKDENQADGKYELCFEPRDFRLGDPIIRSMCHSVADSQRAIIVLTNSYLTRSGRYRMELDFLHDEHLARPFALIFVTTDTLLKASSLPRWLYRAYENGKFLVWNDDAAAKEEFRRKLDRKLRTPPLNRDESFQESV